MAKRIFITATNTDIGKTYITEKLLRIYSEMGYRVGYIKPIETGVLEKPLDGNRLFSVAKLLNPSLSALSLLDVVPYQFKLPASPYVAKENENVKLEKIEEAISKMEKFVDILLIEGAGGLLVPIELDYYISDLISDLKSTPLLVAPTHLGSINDTLLSLEHLQNRSMRFAWTLNLWRDRESFYQITYPFYKNKFGVVPIFQEHSLELAKEILNV
jgi:dethiobiotin synthetase